MSDGPPPTVFPSSTEPFSPTLATPHGTSACLSEEVDRSLREQPGHNGEKTNSAADQRRLADNKNENLQKLNRWLVTGGRAVVSRDSGSSFLSVDLARVVVLPLQLARALTVSVWMVAYGWPSPLAAATLSPSHSRTNKQDLLAKSFGCSGGSGLTGGQVCHSRFLIPGQGAHFEDDLLSQDTWLPPHRRCCPRT